MFVLCVCIIIILFAEQLIYRNVGEVTEYTFLFRLSY